MVDKVKARRIARVTQNKGEQWKLPPYRVKKVVTPLAQTMDWGLVKLGIPSLWPLCNEGEGIKVGIADTGAATTHPDLDGAYEKIQDFTGSRSGPEDKQGHGTHCAGITGARNNQQGVVGIAPKCRIYSAKVLGDDGSGSSRSVARGVDWLAGQGVDIISMSLGSSSPDEQIHRAIVSAVNAGILVIVAAGNSGPGRGTVDYPGRWEENVAVAAIREDGSIAKFSSRGPQVDVAAPGEQILSCFKGNGYAKLSGTSMATPCVAGCAALMLAYHRIMKVKPVSNTAQFGKALEETSIDLGSVGRDEDSGAGLINPQKLVVWGVAPNEMEQKMEVDGEEIKHLTVIFKEKRGAD